MQTDNIIEKARRLGLDTGSSSSTADNLRHIAEQLGINDFNSITDLNKLEQIIDEKLNAQISNENASVSNIQENEMPKPQNRGRFGEQEYNQAKDNQGIFDKNHYKAKQQELDQKLSDAKKEKSLGNKQVGLDENGHNKYKNKNLLDKVNDRVNVAKARQDVISNRLSNAKANAYRAMHPGETLKDTAKSKAKETAKNVGKKAGQAVTKAAGKGLKAAGSAVIKFIAANPIVLLIIMVVALILLILLLFFGTDIAGKNIGYYDSVCNYNETTVELKSCDSGNTESLTLENYVLGETYSYQQYNNFSDEGLKALMIILKTNALSKGDYNSSQKKVTIDDCDMEYTKIDDISSRDLSDLKDLYAEIEEKLFLSESYQSSISSLTAANSLPLNQEELDAISNSNANYDVILDEIYNNSDDESTDSITIYRDTIFVGDSRINGMKNFGLVNNNNSVYAGSMGYYWFVGTASSNNDSSTYNCKSNAIECVNNKIGNSSYNIVIWLGVNDLVNRDNYYDKYYELATGEWANSNIYVFSVGYVDDSRSPYVKNYEIDDFNDYMRREINNSGLSNLNFIDLGFSEETMGDRTSDGVHYDSNFSERIYNKMVSSVSSGPLSGKKAIYNLSDYCVYYNITGNSSYWWPIGSSYATKGNIYGDVPMPTTITSTFGPRQIEGVNGNHGAIDIAGPCNSTVVIATKAGTVTEASNTCDNNGYYGNTCGGGYGNYIIIDHGDGTSSLYGHLYPDSIQVSVGDTVEQGEKIALIGNAGSSTGCHLHFEIRLNGVKVDPLNYVSKDNPRPVNSYNFISDGDASNGKEYICKSLLRSGYSENAVIGIMINLKAESGFVSQRLQGDYSSGYATSIEYTRKVDSGEISKYDFVYNGPNGGGYGLAQWTASGRKENLYNFAKQKNKSIGDVGMQLEFLLNELTTGTSSYYTIPYKYVTGNYSAYDVATNWCDWFEGPSGSEPCRINGSCPSSTCSSRANSSMSEIRTYVKNGCQ